MTPDLEPQWQPVRETTPPFTNTKNCTTIICCHDADNVPTKIAAEKLQTKSKSLPFLFFSKVVSFLSVVCLRLTLTSLANVNMNLGLPVTFENNKRTICQNSSSLLCVWCGKISTAEWTVAKIYRQSAKWSHGEMTKWDGVEMDHIMDLEGNTQCKWTAYFDTYIPQETQ